MCSNIHSDGLTLCLVDPTDCSVPFDKYQIFLGDNDFFKRKDVLNLISKNANSELSRLFRKAYIENLTSIGLKFTDEVNVSNKYTLIFASNNQTGLDFWKKSNKKCTPSGQRTLDL